jgi:hypothetical protein
MSSIASNAEDLILNADGGSSTVKIKINGTEKASISSAGAFTSTTIDATALTGNLPAISAANLTNVPAANITGTLPAISGANLTGIVHNGTFTNDVTINDSSSTPTINFNENDGTQKMKIGFGTYATDEAEWRLTADKPIKFSNNNTVRLTIAAGGAITNSSGVYNTTPTSTTATGWNFNNGGATVTCTQNTAVKIGDCGASGMLIINDTTLNGQINILLTGAGAFTFLGASSHWVNSSSPGTNQVGFYRDSNQIYVKNGKSSTVQLGLMTFRTRNAQ